MDHEPKYNKCVQDDESRDSIDEQQAMLPGDASFKSVQYRNSRSLSSWLISYCVLTSALIPVLVVLVLSNRRTPASNQRYNSTPGGFFGSDTDYMSIDPGYDHLWEELSGGELVINLPDPRFGGKEMPAAFSMFHQLHCLSSFRHAIQMGHQGLDPGVDHRSNPHWPHCFDYMRKTILCWADDTLERQPRFHNGTLAPAITGGHDQRTCGNSDRLIDMMRDGGKPVTTRPFLSAETVAENH